MSSGQELLSTKSLWTISPSQKVRSCIITLAATLAVANIALLFAYYVRLRPSPDQSLFDYMAMLNHLGQVYYRDSFDMTWPGQLIVHDLGLHIFGIRPWTARATDFVFMLLGTLALICFARAAGFLKAGWLLLLVYPTVYVTSGFWMAGHRDIVAMHLLIAASICLIKLERHSLAPGLFVGLATATRPTYLFFAGAVSVCDWWLRQSARHAVATAAWMAGGVVVIASLFLSVGAVSGSVGDWWEAAVRFPTSVYAVDASRWRLAHSFVTILLEAWTWQAAAAFFGVVAWIGYVRNREPFFLILMLTATALVSFVVQNKGFGYHLGGLIPIMSVCACIGCECGWEASRATKRDLLLPIPAGVFAALLLSAGVAARTLKVVKSLAAPTVDLVARDRDRMVSIIQSESGTQTFFYQFGWNYDVAFLSRRRTPTRLVNVPAVALITRQGPFAPWLAELAADIEAKPPTFILLDRTLGSSPAKDAVLAQIRAHYTVRAQTHTMTLYKRCEVSSQTTHH